MSINLDADFHLAVAERSVYENLKDLLAITPSPQVTGLLMLYNTQTNERFAGTVAQDDYQISMAKILQSFFFFAGRLADAQKKDLIARVTGKVQPAAASIKKMLFVSANPADQDAPLQIDVEFNKILAASESGNVNIYNVMMPLLAARLDMLLSAIYEHRPSIIHFSGHGTEEGLILADAWNNSKLVPKDIVDDIFKSVKPDTELVFLNACYSKEQANLISKRAQYVIGTNVAIVDETAIFFAENFYKLIFKGQPIEDAYNNAKILLKNEDVAQYTAVDIWKSGKLVEGL